MNRILLNEDVIGKARKQLADGKGISYESALKRSKS